MMVYINCSTSMSLIGLNKCRNTASEPARELKVSVKVFVFF